MILCIMRFIIQSVQLCLQIQCDESNVLFSNYYIQCVPIKRLMIQCFLYYYRVRQ